MQIESSGGRGCETCAYSILVSPFSTPFSTFAVLVEAVVFPRSRQLTKKITQNCIPGNVSPDLVGFRPQVLPPLSPCDRRVYP